MNPFSNLSSYWLSSVLFLFAISIMEGRSSQAADVISTWDGTTGNWSDAAKWDSLDFPDNGNGGFTYDAILNNGAVMLDVDVIIESLSLGGGTLAGADGEAGQDRKSVV